MSILCNITQRLQKLSSLHLSTDGFRMFMIRLNISKNEELVLQNIFDNHNYFNLVYINTFLSISNC